MNPLKRAVTLVLLIMTPVFAGDFNGGGHALISVPLGSFADVTKTGVGLGGKILYHFDTKPWLNIRTDIGYLSYESTQKPVIAGGYLVTQTIRSEGFNATIGPQLTYSKELFKAYVGAAAGLYYFQTVISYPEFAYYYGIYAGETRDSNACFGGNAGGGVLFDIGLGPWIDIGVKYDYIRKGAIHKVDNQSVKKDAQAITFMIGVVFFTSGNI